MLKWAKLPEGGVLSPQVLSPQQVIDPSAPSAQALPVALPTSVKVPDKGMPVNQG